MISKMNGIEENEALSRHERKCIICHHPDREAIEEEFVNWRNVWRLSKQYEIEDYRSIYRHAHATGLLLRRRENFRSALDQIVENAGQAKVTADSVIRAIRAYSCLDDLGRWTDPPSKVVFTVNRPAQAADPAPIAISPARSASRAGSGQIQPNAPPSPALEPINSSLATETDAAGPVPSIAPQGDAPPARCPAPPVPELVSLQPPTLIYGTGIRNDAKALIT